MKKYKSGAHAMHRLVSHAWLGYHGWDDMDVWDGMGKMTWVVWHG